MGLAFHPVGEPPHPGMVPQRLHRVVTTFEVRVADGEVYVAVAGSTQGDRQSRITPLEFLPTLLPALHLPGAGARKEVVPGKTVLPDVSATELASSVGARLEVFSAYCHLEIIRAAYTNYTVGASPRTREQAQWEGQQRIADSAMTCR